MIHQIEVTIRTPLNPTEDPTHVAEAILELFPDAELDIRDHEVVGVTHSLATLSERLHQREILDTARTEFFDSVRPDGFSFTLKKQPAAVGVPTFAVGEPSELGELNVDVRVEKPDVESLIDHVAPPTVDGTPVTSERQEQREGSR